MVLPYINMNPPQVYTSSHPEHPSLLPPRTIPLGHLSAPAPSSQCHASNLDWRFISYMILYTFQPCPVLTVASWHACRFLKRQVRWSGIPISFRILQFVVIHTVKGFGIVKKAEVMFFWNFLAFSVIQWILAIWSLVPLPFLNPAWTSGSSWLTYCWSLGCRILNITLLACEMNAIVQ